MAKKISIEDREFPRKWSYSSDTHTVTGCCQPYLTGMYVAIEDSEVSQLIQMNLPHKSLNNWFKKFKKAMEEMGMTGEVSYGNYVDYLPKEEMEKYDIFK